MCHPTYLGRLTLWASKDADYSDQCPYAEPSDLVDRRLVYTTAQAVIKKGRITAMRCTGIDSIPFRLARTIEFTHILSVDLFAWKFSADVLI